MLPFFGLIQRIGKNILTIFHTERSMIEFVIDNLAKLLTK